MCETLVTTSPGPYGNDRVNNSGPDLALTRRFTFGWQRYGGDFHSDLSLTLHEGKFDRIAARLGIQQADHVTPARFDADRAGALGVKSLCTRGSLHLSAGGFIGDYRGRSVNGRARENGPHALAINHQLRCRVDAGCGALSTAASRSVAASVSQRAGPFHLSIQRCGGPCRAWW